MEKPKKYSKQQMKIRTKTWKARQVRMRKMFEILHVVFPKAFPSLQQRAPLKVGIHLDLRREFPKLSHKAISNFLRWWVKGESYKVAVAAELSRVDLYGNYVT